MKQSSFNPAELAGSRILILSDGKPGHFNQAIAFARHLGCRYDVVSVALRSRALKWLSYLLDNCGIHRSWLFSATVPEQQYSAVVSAGSGTYYANKTTARQLDCPAVAIMYPRGYRLDFDLIVAQEHDRPPEKANILSLPVNLSYAEPNGVVTPAPQERYISFIIGGDSSRGRLEAGPLEQQIKCILELFPEHRLWLTTSRRTPAAVDKMLRQFDYARAVFYSEEQVNPIADFLAYSEYVFLTADSSSMISEAVCSGAAAVEVLPLLAGHRERGKLSFLIERLEQLGSLHVFDGRVGAADRKIHQADILNGIAK